MTGSAGEPPVLLSFSSNIFDVEAVKRAAYRFSDRVSIEINSSDDAIQCKLHSLERDGSSDMIAVANQFRNEVLDQDLRQRIAAETASYRNLILSLAFSKTPLGK